MSKSATAADLGADRAKALAITPVSAEVAARLDTYVALLLKWQNTTNLISPATIPEIWTRHVADSLQLLDIAPDAKVWVDFGSGGGFPAIPIACALAGRSGAEVHLVESNGKKAAFLREAARVAGAPAVVHAERAENYGDSFSGRADVVSARALAPLKVLCEQAFPLLERGGIAIFPKGQDVEAELTEASRYWKIEADKIRSRTSPDGVIVVIRQLQRRENST